MKLGRRETIKRTLKALRATADLSQMAVAERIGVTGRRYWLIENGYEQPTATECNRLAKVLKVKVDELGFPSCQVEARAS